MKKNRIAMLAFLALLFTGCAHVYHVGIDAISAGPEMTGKTFVVMPGNANTDASDLQFREYALYVSRALQQQGYVPAKLNQAPDMEGYLAYGLGTPQARVRSYSVPVWGQTSTEVTTTEQTTKTHNSSTTTSTTNVTPEYGVTGFTTQEESYTVIPKYIEIDTYDVRNLKPGDKALEIWKTTIHAEGKRNELRHVFPILVAGAAKYLGANTGKEIDVTLTENQPEVRTIKGLKE